MFMVIPAPKVASGNQIPMIPCQLNGPVLKKIARTPPAPVIATQMFAHAAQRGHTTSRR